MMVIVVGSRLAFPLHARLRCRTAMRRSSILPLGKRAGPPSGQPCGPPALFMPRDQIAKRPQQVCTLEAALRLLAAGHSRRQGTAEGNGWRPRGLGFCSPPARNTACIGDAGDGRLGSTIGCGSWAGARAATALSESIRASRAVQNQSAGCMARAFGFRLSSPAAARLPSAAGQMRRVPGPCRTRNAGRDPVSLRSGDGGAAVRRPGRSLRRVS